MLWCMDLHKNSSLPRRSRKHLQVHSKSSKIIFPSQQLKFTQQQSDSKLGFGAELVIKYQVWNTGLKIHTYTHTRKHTNPLLTCNSFKAQWGIELQHHQQCEWMAAIITDTHTNTPRSVGMNRWSASDWWDWFHLSWRGLPGHIPPITALSVPMKGGLHWMELVEEGWIHRPAQTHR